MIMQKEILNIFNSSEFCDKCAISYGENQITYNELKNRSIKIAQSFINEGQKDVIGVLLSDRCDYIISAISILLAGQVFCMIDDKYPEQYIANMIEQADIKFILHDAGTSNRAQDILALTQNHVQLKQIDKLLMGEPKLDTYLPSYNAKDPIYVYFTSGTTGIQKAILGKNEGLTHFINWEKGVLSLKDNIRTAQFTSQSHDPFLRDIFLPLLSGGTVCIPDKSVQSNSDIVSWINNNKVNVIHCTPSFFKYFAPPNSSFTDYPNLKYILLAGEKVHASALHPWYEQFGEKISLINLYGPTETTLAKIYHPINKSDVDNYEIPIGKPINDTEIYILDENMTKCEIGQVGEIYIKTEYKTHGYLSAGKLDKECFVYVSSNINDLLYKTGDFGFINNDGNIVFKGRKDNEIKYRGYRINLSTIADKIKEIEGIDDVVMVYNEKHDVIISYVVSKCEVDDVNIAKHIGRALPWYMIPEHFVKIDMIPLTINYKIDIKKLPLPDVLEVSKQSTETEKMLTEIWERLLERSDIGLNDNFFRLGGHSMLMLKMQYELSLRNIEISADKLFVNQTISMLSNFIESGEYSE